MKAALAAIIGAALMLSACGVGGMTRAMQPVVEGFEEGERVSRKVRQGRE